MSNECKLCSFTTNNKYNYKRHLKSKKHKDAITIKKTTIANSGIMCDDCGYKFTHLNNLYRHKKKACKSIMTNLDDDLESTLSITPSITPSFDQNDIPQNTLDADVDNEIVSLKNGIQKLTTAFNQNFANISNRLDSLENEIANLKSDNDENKSILDDYSDNLDEINNDMYIVKEKLKPLSRFIDETDYD